MILRVGVKYDMITMIEGLYVLYTVLFVIGWISTKASNFHGTFPF